MTPSFDPNDPFRLPPTHRIDESLKDLIPAKLNVDYRHFARVAECPDRYIVNLFGRGVIDLQRGCWLTPQYLLKKRRKGQKKREKSLRRWFYLNMGRGLGRRPFYNSRLVAAAAYGPPPTSKHQADHNKGLDGRDECEAWYNLSWATGDSNRKAEIARRNAAPLKDGDRRVKLTPHNLKLFRAAVENDTKSKNRILWEAYASHCNVSARQLRRIVKGESRKGGGGKVL